MCVSLYNANIIHVSLKCEIDKPIDFAPMLMYSILIIIIILIVSCVYLYMDTYILYGYVWARERKCANK